METNQELKTAWDFVEHTGVSIFLTGKAGTGKTTFLQEVARHSAKTMIVVAPTGVAAVNAGGVTIHSFFQLPLSPFVPGAEQRDRYGFAKDKLRIVRALDLLVIDEISMVRADLLDAIDAALRKYRRSPLPFGGVQLLMIGDLQQLAPVVTPADEAMIKPYYDTPYFFSSHALAKIPYVTIQLSRVFRQQNLEFVNLLNHVRTGFLTPEDHAMLSSRLDPNFRPAANSDYIRLTTHNAMADDYNATSLQMLPGQSRRYSAEITGNFPEMSYPTARDLQLKTGAQVMFIKNDTEAGRYYNGRIGHVTGLDNGKVYVRCPGDAQDIEVVPQKWENSKYTINETTNTIETKVDGEFSQLPLRLAWAVTIHKSQGLTFDHVIIDAGRSFAPGQVYVALSRCRTLKGIVLATPISDSTLRNDLTVTEYISHQDAAARESLEHLPAIKTAFRRHLMNELFNFRDITDQQGALQRLVAKELAHSYPSVNAEQTALTDSLREKVTAVADKWASLLATVPDNGLQATATLDRIASGCRYFADTLRDAFGTSLGDATRIRIGDKQVMKRLDTILTDLKASLKSRVALLDSIAVHGFTTANYLNYKQQATLGSTDTNTAVKKERTRKTSRTKTDSTPKPKPEKSASISLKMLRQGMTRQEIAEERNLSVSTVTGHLRQYIESGELSFEDVYTPAMYNAMVSAVRKYGTDNGLEPIIKALADTGISPFDIRFYLQYLRNNKN